MTSISKNETTNDQPPDSCRNCLKIYTDGGYVKKKDIGGWGIVIIAPDKQQLKFSGTQRNTSSLEMELKAAVHALEQIQHLPLNDLIIQLFTDSKILIEGLDYKIRQYRQQDWIHKSGRPVESRTLWEKLESLTQALKVNVQWVKGHSKIQGNLMADQLARDAIQDLNS